MIVIKLSPRNKAPRPPKLKYETLYISGIFVKLECQAPLHERKPTYWRLSGKGSVYTNKVSKMEG